MSDPKLSQSGLTMHSDSELYSESPDADYQGSSQSQSPSPPLVVYKPPSMWLLVRGMAINLLLPFINGMMLGFGELFAHEAAFRLGWGGTKVFPLFRRTLGLGQGEGQSQSQSQSQSQNQTLNQNHDMNLDPHQACSCSCCSLLTEFKQVFPITRRRAQPLDYSGSQKRKSYYPLD